MLLLIYKVCEYIRSDVIVRHNLSKKPHLIGHFIKWSNELKMSQISQTFYQECNHFFIKIILQKCFQVIFEAPDNEPSTFHD